MQKSTNWSKVGAVLAGLAVVGACGVPFVANNQADTNANSIEGIATQLTALEEKVDAGIDVDVNVTEGEITQEIYDKLFEEDALEAEAEVLAMEELEDDDYEELADYLRIDEDSIDKVVVKETTTNVIGNPSNKNVDVEFELKVYVENRFLDINYKEYITATVEIRDGEVEDITFSYTR